MTGSVPFDRDQLAALIDERIGRTRLNFKPGALKAAVRTDYGAFADSYRRTMERLGQSVDAAEQGRNSPVDQEQRPQQRLVLPLFGHLTVAIGFLAQCFQVCARDVRVLWQTRYVHSLAPSSLAGTESVGAPGRGGGVSRGQGKHPGGTR